MRIVVATYTILIASSLLNYTQAVEEEEDELEVEVELMEGDLPDKREACLNEVESKISRLDVPGHIEKVEAAIRRKNEKLAGKTMFQIFDEELKIKGLDKLNPDKTIKDICTEYGEDVLNIVKSTGCGLNLLKGIDQKGRTALIEDYPHWKEAMVAVRLCPVSYD